MATYAIGDVQGCYDKLLSLLEKIQFKDHDILWFTGDLVNRGKRSLDTLRFVKSLGHRALMVLGNHELGMLAIARGCEPFDPNKHTFEDILQAPDKEELLLWLEQQPLLHQDTDLNYTLVHAGIYPFWDLSLATQLAREVETCLQSPEKQAFYAALYGNKPKVWDPKLSGHDRLRFIVNAFTRMRFCSMEGELELQTKESLQQPPSGFLPWFSMPERRTKGLRILFGHWAALMGNCPEPNTFALDTGCVWGNCLTAMRLEDGQRFTVAC